MKQLESSVQEEPVMRDGIPIPTLEQVREVVEMAWTDASNLPTQLGQQALCAHLRRATEALDRMIERKAKR